MRRKKKKKHVKQAKLLVHALQANQKIIRSLACLAIATVKVNATLTYQPSSSWDLMFCKTGYQNAVEVWTFISATMTSNVIIYTPQKSKKIVSCRCDHKFH